MHVREVRVLSTCVENYHAVISLIVITSLWQSSFKIRKPVQFVFYINLLPARGKLTRVDRQQRITVWINVPK